jgi:lipoprotein-releasing system permease protein
MKPTGFLALRYALAGRQHRIIQWIARVAFVGVAVGTAAMLTVLSGFNGLDTLVRQFYGDFDPDLKIVPAAGKTFWAADFPFEALQTDAIKAFSAVREERALLRLGDQEYLATIKEVDTAYALVSGVAQRTLLGYYPQHPEQGGFFGAGVAYGLGAHPESGSMPTAYLPGEEANLSNPLSSFNILPLPVAGVFAIQPDFDMKYVVVPFPFLTGEGRERYTALEVALKDPSDRSAEDDLQRALGAGYSVLNREEQAASVFKVLRSEGLITYLVFAFVLLLATFSLLGAVVMAILEKRRDAYVLLAMGLTPRQVRSVFFRYGLWIGGTGGLAGLILGAALVWAQDTWGWVKLGAGYMIESYPVELRGGDVVLIAATVALLSSLVSALAVSRFQITRQS